MLDENLIKKQLKTSFFGRYLYIFPEIESTNKYARKLVKEGAPEGTVVLTDYQTNGRGRLGHDWESSRAVNILMSIVLRPRIDVESVQCITLVTANIIIDSLERFLKKETVTQIKFQVKWPNDILINGKKIAGILCESSSRERLVEHIIVGMGINVNQDVAEFSDEIQHKTTSLFAETSKQLSREELIAQILFTYEKNYINFQRTNYKPCIEKWKRRCDQIGESLLIETPVSVEPGKFIDIDNKGVLIYQTQDGKIKKLIAGDVKYKDTAHGING
jgi:BirA family biotin operon repressor/biotin-[acetyl-CoA-carboxylase] ligase